MKILRVIKTHLEKYFSLIELQVQVSFIGCSFVRLLILFTFFTSLQKPLGLVQPHCQTHLWVKARKCTPFSMLFQMVIVKWHLLKIPQQLPS